MDELLALLRLQVEWGADEAIDLDPVVRLRSLEPKPVLRPLSVPAAPMSLGTPGERALAAAAQAATLDALRSALGAFDGCALRDTASNLVFAEGNPASTTLIIGDQPGREEDRSGRPFAGAEGQLLDEMLASIGLSRSEFMLSPLLPWRPPGGRPASAAEMSVCLPFLHRLVELLRPRRIVVFGATAARVLLGSGSNKRRNRRDWAECGIPGLPDPLPILPLPGFPEMARNLPLRREAWAGLRRLKRTIDQD